MKTCSIDGCANKHEAKGLCGKHYARLKRLGNPILLKTKERGCERLDGGYVVVLGRKQHISVAEKAFGGSLPKGSVVHHVDYDKTNNTPSNLVVCTRSYHRLIHQRTDALNNSGNASFRKCSFCKKYDDPKNLIKTGGSQIHQECRNKRHKEKRGNLFYYGTIITAFGKSLSLKEWSEIYGVSRATIQTRIKELGWDIEAAISKPARKKAIQDGYEVPGCHLTRTQSLQIK